MERKKPKYEINEPVALHGLIVSKKIDPDSDGWMYEVKLSETEDPFWIRGNQLYNTEYDGIG